jgi:hypothetical protein
METLFFLSKEIPLKKKRQEKKMILFLGVFSVYLILSCLARGWEEGRCFRMVSRVEMDFFSIIKLVYTK